jgi:hypothetical protein
MSQLRLPLQACFWVEVRDGDKDAFKLYLRHYSARHYRGRQRKHSLFVGPGEKQVLMAPDCTALFVWRKFRSKDHQQGINCAVFRNESDQLSSELIIEAEAWAIARWGAQRAYTYINPRKVKSPHPGYCFKCAGWKSAGRTKKLKLVILEKELRQ